MTTAGGEREPVTPTLDVPLQAAIEEMTGFEALGIEKRYGRKLEELGGMALTIGVVWVYENRGGKKTSWTAVEQWTLRELNGYFQQPAEDVNEDEPDTPLGKGS